MTDDDLKVNFTAIGVQITALSASTAELSTHMAEVADALLQLRRNTDEGFRQVKDDLKELKASARVLDLWLEKHLLDRVERIEHALNLPPYVHHHSDED